MESTCRNCSSRSPRTPGCFFLRTYSTAMCNVQVRAHTGTRVIRHAVLCMHHACEVYTRTRTHKHLHPPTCPHLHVWSGREEPRPHLPHGELPSGTTPPSCPPSMKPSSRFAAFDPSISCQWRWAIQRRRQCQDQDRRQEDVLSGLPGYRSFLRMLFTPL